MHTSRPSRRLRARAAFTLVELLAALVLVAIGLLALSATSALVMREVGAAAARASAGAVLRNRIERFVLEPCRAVVGDVTWPHGVREMWRSEPGARSAFLRDSVEFLELGRRRALSIAARRLCP